jgi:hypothetical protein
MRQLGEKSVATAQETSPEPQDMDQSAEKQLETAPVSPAEFESAQVAEQRLIF